MISRGHFQINHIAETAADGDGPAIVIATDWLGRLPGDRRLDGAQRREYGCGVGVLQDVFHCTILVIAMAAAGYVFGPHVAETQILGQLSALIGDTGVLLWIYYSAQIFLLGAEFTRVVTYKHGSRRSSPRI